MEINKKILSIMRILESIPGYDRSKQAAYIYNANKMLDDDDRAVLTDVLKAMILLTAGNQRALRDPYRYSVNSAREPYGRLLGRDMGKIIEKFGLNIDLNSKPTRPDYIIAHKLLPIIGSSSVSPEDIMKHTDSGTKKPLDRYGSEGRKTLYRGIQVSLNLIMSATKRKTWNIGRGVSTSHIKKKGYEFAKSAPTMFGANGGPALLLIIDNKSMRGFHAGSLSRYEREGEVILAGMLDFGNWQLEAKSFDEDNGECALLFNSVTETVELKQDRENEHGYPVLTTIQALQFPLQNGTTFRDFLEQAIGNLSWSVPEFDGGKTYSTNEGTVLLKMQATLE